MKKFKFSFIMASILIICFMAYTLYIPDSISVYSDQIVRGSIQGYPMIRLDSDSNASATLFGIPIKNVKLDVYNRTELTPGGTPFGIKFFTEGLIVVGITSINTAQGAQSPAKQAGLEKGDIITKVNGTAVTNSDEFIKTVSSLRSSFTVTVLRNDKEEELIITPVLSSEDSTYKIGVWVRDSTAGIGTVTFVDKETGVFGGLGHGINDTETGVLLPLGSATVVKVDIYDVIKGKENSPGELRGRFSSIRTGLLTANTNSGVFGLLLNTSNYQQALPIGLKSEAHTGTAYIMTTLDSSSGVEKFEIKITKINKSDPDGKNYCIKVTDSRLIEKSGGIVQGMSGSPIIQDGKLIGAVTHVLVSDPTKGYGIFIENMLSRISEDILS